MNMEGGKSDILQLLDLETSFSQENAAGHTSLPGNLSPGEQRLQISIINARRREILIFHSYLQSFISYLNYSNLASSMGCLQSICLNASAHLKLKCDWSKIKNRIEYRIKKSEIYSSKTEKSKLLGCRNRKAQLIPEQVDSTGCHSETTENLQSNTDIV